MTFPSSQDISMGRARGWYVVHKFGHDDATPTTFRPVARGGLYRTPQVAGATALRVKAGNLNDAPGQSGARSIFIQGLDATGAEVSEEIATNGTSAGGNSSNSYIRLYRAYVAASGTYATSTAGSHAAEIVIENAAGTEDWAAISATGFPSAQTEIGAYTVPLGYTAFMIGLTVEAEATKKVDALFFQRRNILETAAPYSAMREVQRFIGLEGVVTETFDSPVEFPPLTDIGVMAELTSGGQGTGAVSVDFELLLRRDD